MLGTDILGEANIARVSKGGRDHCGKQAGRMTIILERSKGGFKGSFKKLFDAKSYCLGCGDAMVPSGREHGRAPV